MGNHRLSMPDSPHKGQSRVALVFSLICAWTNDWPNNPDAGHLRRHRAHHDLTVMFNRNSCGIQENLIENDIWKMAAILSRAQCVNGYRNYDFVFHSMFTRTRLHVIISAMVYFGEVINMLNSKSFDLNWHYQTIVDHLRNTLSIQTQMNFNMTQFGVTQNQKQPQARTLLWGEYMKVQPCFPSACVRSSEHKAFGRFITMKVTATSLFHD